MARMANPLSPARPQPASAAPGASAIVHALAATYDYAWFIGFAVSFTIYLALMRDEPARLAAHGRTGRH